MENKCFSEIALIKGTALIYILQNGVYWQY